MRLTFVTFTSAALLAIASPVFAGPIVWQFDGVVTGTNQSSPLDSIPMGTSVALSVILDPGAIDQCASAGRGFYVLPGSTVTMFGVTYQSASNALEVNNPAGNCFGPIPSPAIQDNVLRMVGFAGAPFTSVTVSWPGADGGEGMPVTAPDLVGFALNFNCVVCSNRIGEAALVTAVPEPGSMLLLLTGIGGLVGNRGRRRSSK